MCDPKNHDILFVGIFYYFKFEHLRCNDGHGRGGESFPQKQCKWSSYQLKNTVSALETLVSRVMAAPASSGHPRVKAGRGWVPLRTVKLRRIGNCFVSRVVVGVMDVLSSNPFGAFKRICSGAPGKALARPECARRKPHQTRADI